MRRAGLILALAALLPLVATAATYRWVDGQGHTHFSDVPAPKSERVEVKPTSGVTRDAHDGESAKRAEACRRQQDQLANYSAASEIRETDALGNTRSYSAEEKTRLLDRTRQQMEEACKGLPQGNAAPEASAPPSAPQPAPPAAPRRNAPPGAAAES